CEFNAVCNGIFYFQVCEKRRADRIVIYMGCYGKITRKINQFFPRKGCRLLIQFIGISSGKCSQGVQYLAGTAKIQVERNTVADTGQQLSPCRKYAGRCKPQRTDLLLEIRRKPFIAGHYYF